MSQPVARPERRYWPLGQLVLARLREFWREPEAVFWVYGFPILLTVALGIAFRNKPVEKLRVDVVAGAGAEAVEEKLTKNDRFTPATNDLDTCRRRLRTGKTELVIVPQATGLPRYLFVPSRTESRLARDEVEAYLREPERRDLEKRSEGVDEPGGRYIDFLVPGLLAMGLMGGGLWGVGFVTVDMRIRKLLKRFLATPMRKVDFLAALLLSRLVFMIPEVVFLLVFAWLAFGVTIAGSVLSVVALILLGAFAFAGLGLLVASRAKTQEAVSGLMNLTMLPMWVFSGAFFSRERFPDQAQPFIQALPLTPLIDALRAVMNEGASLTSQWPALAILAAWGLISFVLALRWFRWG